MRTLLRAPWVWVDPFIKMIWLLSTVIYRACPVNGRRPVAGRKQRLSYNYTHLVVLSAVVVRVVRLWCGLLVDVVWKGH